MKVFYLSSSAYSDNQVSLLHRFSGDYDITYGVIFPDRNSNYTPQEIGIYCQEHNISYMPFPLKYRFRDPRNFEAYYRIVSVINAMKPDVVFVANFDQLYLSLMLLLLDRNKTIIGLHDVENHSNTAFGKLATLAKTILLKNFRNFLTYSLHQKEALNAAHQGKNVYTIPLPLIDFGNLPENPGQNKEVRFLFFGNILSYKGLDILIEAVNRLSKKHKGFKLIIAGRCKEWEQTYAPSIADGVTVDAHIGFIENSEIPHYFANADYLVLPYRDTTQSGPLMIAYNYNLPVIASNADGFKEFFRDGVTGYVYQQQIPDDIDRILEEAILRNNQEYQQIKESQRQYVALHFSAEQLTRAYQDMFDDVASQKLNTVVYEKYR